MNYYKFGKIERQNLKQKIEVLIKEDIKNRKFINILKYSSDNDTYIRKNAYLAIGKIYQSNEETRNEIIFIINELLNNNNEKVRQTAVYAAGEIGKINFNDTIKIFEKAFFDKHHSVLNAITGSLKQLGKINPKPTLSFIKEHIDNVDSKIKVKLLHGLELRGRTYPEEILPILVKYEDKSEIKIEEMIIHILGQISYKKGCLEKVIFNIKEWKNKDLVAKALKEIIKVHHNYSKFAYYSSEEAKSIIKSHINIL